MPVDMSDGHPDSRLEVLLEPPAACVQPSNEDAEHEASDVREERHASSIRLRAEDAYVRFVQLVQEPEAEEEPGRDPDGEDGIPELRVAIG